VKSDKEDIMDDCNKKIKIAGFGSGLYMSDMEVSRTIIEACEIRPELIEKVPGYIYHKNRVLGERNRNKLLQRVALVGIIAGVVYLNREEIKRFVWPESPPAIDKSIIHVPSY
jgi:hypothetical protein